MHFSIFFISLLTRALESLLNSLLFPHHRMHTPRQELSGKVLQIKLKELICPLIFVFSEQRVTVLIQHEDHPDCIINSGIFSLLKSYNFQQLLALIDCGEISVEGDAQVIQQLLSLLEFTQLDVAEFFALYVGDIAAQSITQALDSQAIFLKYSVQRWHEKIAEILTEEWRILPSILEMAWFNKDIHDITDRTQALINRINNLERKL